MSQISAREYKTKAGKVVQIRTAEHSDAAGFLEHKRVVMAETPYTLTTPDELSNEQEESKWIQNLKESPSSLLIIAIYQGVVVGGLDFSSGHRRRIAHTGDFGMSVSMGFRSEGIGSALLECLLEWAVAHPVIEKVYLKVHASNHLAVGLYKKMGFHQEGRQVKDLKYGPNDYDDTLLMAKFVKV